MGIRQAGLQRREQARGGEGTGLRGGKPDPRRSEEGLVWWGGRHPPTPRLPAPIRGAAGLRPFPLPPCAGWPWKERFPWDQCPFLVRVIMRQESGGSVPERVSGPTPGYRPIDRGVNVLCS